MKLEKLVTILALFDLNSYFILVLQVYLCFSFTASEYMVLEHFK